MEFGIGGTEKPREGGTEAFADLSMNRTLFVQKLTGDAPYTPEMVQDLKTVDEVFGYYKPTKEIDFTSEEGAPITEELTFGGLGDFGRKGIIKQSKYLQEVNNKQ